MADENSNGTDLPEDLTDEALGITAYATPDEEPAGAAAGAGRSA